MLKFYIYFILKIINQENILQIQNEKTIVLLHITIDPSVVVPLQLLNIGDACKHLLANEGSMLQLVPMLVFQDIVRIQLQISMLAKRKFAHSMIFILTVNSTMGLLHHTMEYGKLVGFTHASQFLPKVCGVHRSV